jgi:adenylate kinase
MMPGADGEAKRTEGDSRADRRLLVILGPPGAGKSTLVARILAAHPTLAHFATRRQFLWEEQHDTDLWRAAAEYHRRREWIPDGVVMEAFTRRLDRQLPGGMLIEGLPANGAQAELLVDELAQRGLRIDLALYLDVPDTVALERKGARQVCTNCDGGIAPAPRSPSNPGRCARCDTPLSRRPDDEDDGLSRQRISLHRAYIDDVLAAFDPERTVRIDGQQPPATIETLALDLVDQAWPDQSGVVNRS